MKFFFCCWYAFDLAVWNSSWFVSEILVLFFWLFEAGQPRNSAVSSRGEDQLPFNTESANGFITIHEKLPLCPTQPCMHSTHDPMIPQTGIDNITQEKTQDHGRTHNMYCMHPWHHLTQRPRTAKV
jgi:hypothetical protein